MAECIPVTGKNGQAGIQKTGREPSVLLCSLRTAFSQMFLGSCENCLLRAARSDAVIKASYLVLDPMS